MHLYWIFLLLLKISSRNSGMFLHMLYTDNLFCMLMQQQHNFQKIESIPFKDMGCTDSKTISVSSAQAPAAVVQDQHQPVSAASNLVNGSSYETVVIGGGIAGVTTAVELAKKGQKVAVLQANGYLGGRMKSIPVKLMSGSIFQFQEGANWIHGSCKKHPITKLSKQVQNLVMKQIHGDSVEYYDEKGEEVYKEAEKAEKKFYNLLQKCDEWEPQYSMQEALKKEGGNVLNDKFFMFHIGNDTEFRTSGSIRNLAANTFDDDEFDGKQMLILSGYQRFVETISKQEDIQVYLGQKVKAVIENEGRSEIVCANGTSIYAKNVVVAVPVGVLKANAIKFEPRLPDWKQEAIQSIGFGNVCKILIDFPNKKLFDVKSHYIGVVSENVNQRGLAAYYLNLQAVAGIPCLMTYGLGDSADVAERMPEAELKSLIARRLSAFSEQRISPQDFRIYRTVWKGHENFLGTYSYASTTTRPKHWLNMAKPIFNSNWYFCGQHTTSRYRSTVHGAYLSGIHTARYILQQVEQSSWKYPDFKKNKNDKQESLSSSS